VAAARTIIVAGAGIGGLTAALSLAAKGFRVIILEKAERLEEAGAGLQLSPNASRILVDLGLQPRLAPRAVTPEAINIISARAGGEIARLPLGEAAGLRAGAPYWVTHRADLQGALQAQVNDHPDIDLRLGCQFEDMTSHARGLTVVQRRGSARQQELAAALVGADGIWSAVRNQLFPEVQPQFSGLIAWRGTLDATTLPREYTAPRVQLWMGPEAHLVAYPISAARQINVVAIVPGTWNRPGWSAPADANELKTAFASQRWPATARMLLGAVDGWRRWALFTLPDLGQWTNGAVALLGDAAHAMLPHHGQGANQALEDAVVLARLLAGTDADGVAGALRAYERLRRPRTRLVQAGSRKNAGCFQLPDGPEAEARNERLTGLPDDLAWIHGYDALAALRTAPAPV
jgi:salicylate hydroxylase